jgi:TDG/mug DNA glycosylase family protein
VSAYLVIYERAEDGGWGAYFPELPGVVALGTTREKVAQRIREALGVYVEEMSELGKRLPAPTTSAEIVEADRSTPSVGELLDGNTVSVDPGHRVTEVWLGEEVPSLADLLRPGLRGVVVGINPSTVSVAAGHYYQGRLGQRFFSALLDAGVLPHGDGFEDDRAFKAGLGFTDVVKRATARETGLRTGELQHGRQLLEARLSELAVPRIIFTYKKAATTLLGPFDGFGLRPGRPLAGAEVFVMCGPMAKREDRARAIRDLREWWSS